jgi:hypothetical protein
VAKWYRKKIWDAEAQRIKKTRRKGIEEQGGELSFEDLVGVNDAPLRLGALSSALV